MILRLALWTFQVSPSFLWHWILLCVIVTDRLYLKAGLMVRSWWSRSLPVFHVKTCLEPHDLIFYMFLVHITWFHFGQSYHIQSFREKKKRKKKKKANHIPVWFSELLVIGFRCSGLKLNTLLLKQEKPQPVAVERWQLFFMIASLLMKLLSNN